MIEREKVSNNEENTDDSNSKSIKVDMKQMLGLVDNFFDELSKKNAVRASNIIAGYVEQKLKIYHS